MMTIQIQQHLLKCITEMLAMKKLVNMVSVDPRVTLDLCICTGFTKHQVSDLASDNSFLPNHAPLQTLCRGRAVQGLY